MLERLYQHMSERRGVRFMPLVRLMPLVSLMATVSEGCVGRPEEHHPAQEC